MALYQLATKTTDHLHTRQGALRDACRLLERTQSDVSLNLTWQAYVDELMAISRELNARDPGRWER